MSSETAGHPLSLRKITIFDPNWSIPFSLCLGSVEAQSGNEVMSPIPCLWQIIFPVLWLEGDTMGKGGRGVPLAWWYCLSPWNGRVGLPHETLITVSAGLKSSSPTTALLRS
jgi:hypothetical protein